MRKRFELALGLSAALTVSPAYAAEQHTFSRLPQMTMSHQAPRQENPMAGADTHACVHGPEQFELGAYDPGTFNDGMRILSSIGTYYFERNTGTLEQQIARAGQYQTSLENCSADDLRVAAFMLNTWFPETQIQNELTAPLLITARSFAVGEIRQRLENAVLSEARSGV